MLEPTLEQSAKFGASLLTDREETLAQKLDGKGNYFAKLGPRIEAASTPAEKFIVVYSELMDEIRVTARQIEEISRKCQHLQENKEELRFETQDKLSETKKKLESLTQQLLAQMLKNLEIRKAQEDLRETNKMALQFEMMNNEIRNNLDTKPYTMTQVNELFEKLNQIKTIRFQQQKQRQRELQKLNVVSKQGNNLNKVLDEVNEVKIKADIADRETQQLQAEVELARKKATALI